MFSDESCLSLQFDSLRTFIRRTPGTCYHQENIIERHRFGGTGLLVWRGRGRRICVYELQRPSSPCKYRKRMPSIGGNHSYGLANILTGPESSRACVGHAWTTSFSPSTASYMSTRTSESIA
ncbi:nibrin [Trichonephila clavipes]|nr:nibrin [Trichonephila clavipes]